MHLRNKIRRWIWVGLLSFCTSLGLMHDLCLAQEVDPTKEPARFVPSEVIAGGIGALIGGMLGVEYISPLVGGLLKIPPCPKWFSSDDPCQIPRNIGAFIGSTTLSGGAVVLMGLRYGVQGNVGLAFLGAAVGTSLSLLVGNWVGIHWYRYISYQTFFWIALSLVTLPPGILATMGFNWGATMKVKVMSVSPSGLELISAQLRW